MASVDKAPAAGLSSSHGSAGLLERLAGLLERLGITYRLHAGKLLMPAVWHGKTRFTVAVWPNGGWNNAAALDEHGTWRALLARLGIEETGEQDAFEQAAARVDVVALAQQQAQAHAQRIRQAQALHRRALTLHHAENPHLRGTGQPLIEDRRRKGRHRRRIEPALKYLARRGLSAAVIEAVCGLIQPGRARETIIRYVDQGPQGGMLLFPIQNGTGFAPAQVIGVQRIYLDPSGGKRPVGEEGETKRMLGAAFYTQADVPRPVAGACWLHRDARPGGTVILCEGPETGLGCWDLSDLNAIIGIHFSASGLAHPDVERIQRLQPEQVIMAADHDLSGTGERAARRGAWQLHQAGLKVAIALPPRVLDGQPVGTAKSTDWLDVLNVAGRKRTGRLLLQGAEPYVPSPLDAALPLALAARSAAGAGAAAAPAGSGSVTTLHRLRPTATAPTPPARLAPAEAQALNAQLTRAAVQSPQGLTLLAGQTGIGKSHALREALAQPDTPPALVLAPTTALVSDFVARYPGQDLAQYLGRSPEPQSPGHCLRFPQIEDLRAGRRSIVAHECQHCPHGLAASPRADAQEKLLAALNRELYRDCLDLNDPQVRRDLRREAAQVQPCPWIQHRDKLPLYPHVAASHAAYAQDHAHTLDKTAGGGPPRQVIFDESPPGFEETVITPQVLAQWIAKNRADAAHPPEGMAAADWATLNGRMDTALRTLARLLGQYPDAYNHRLSAAELDVQQLITTIETFPRALDGLRPEAVITDRQGCRVIVPLRALDDLKRALELRSAWIHHGLLYFAVPTRASEDLLQRRRPVVIADATPRRLAQALATAHHPLLVDTPNQTIHLHTGRLHGKASVEDKRERADLLQAMTTAVAAQGAGRVGVLTHKKLAQPLIEQVRQGRVQGWRPEDAALIGWFGRHDRGQNDWMDLKLLIQWGVHRPSPAVMQRLYEAERALLAQAGLHWQPWSEERAEQWFALPYQAGDGSGLELAARMTTNPDQLAWERDWVTAQVVQGSGRLRAVQRPHEALEIHLYTHYPLAGHGLWLDQVHAPGPRAGGQQARHAWRQALHDNSQTRYDQARAAGAHSRRAINRFLKAQGLATLSGKTYRWLRTQARAAVPGAPPAQDAALEAAIERVVAFILAGAEPVHGDEIAALALEYAESVEDPLDRLAGRLLAYAVVAPVSEHPSWSAVDSERGPDIPPRPD